MHSSNRKQIINSILIFIAALIWGTAFVAQSEGANYIDGFTFTALRNYIGTAFLIPVAIIAEKIAKRNRQSTPDDTDLKEVTSAHMIGPFTKSEVLGGFICGTALMTASCFQQIGIAHTTVAKSGFLTALYVILVPIFGIFLGHKFRPYLAICMGLSVVGMYFLCLYGTGDLSFNYGDILEILCSFFFTIQILSVSHFAERCRGIILSLIEFFFCAIESTVLMILFEDIRWDAVLQALPSLIYVGIFSSGIAYTLQIIAEKNMNPALASLIMSLESVISAVSAWIILGQSMSGSEIFGGIMMFVSIVIAQVYPIRKPEKNQDKI